MLSRVDKYLGPTNQLALATIQINKYDNYLNLINIYVWIWQMTEYDKYLNPQTFGYDK